MKTWDATNSVRLCDRCESENGITAGADAGDTACSTCGIHDAPHIYPALRECAMNYEIRRCGPDDRVTYNWERWAIHKAGLPWSIVEFAFTKRGANRKARRRLRAEIRSRESYPA